MAKTDGAIANLTSSVHQNMAKTDGAIADLTKHMSQLVTSISALTNEPGRLPSQTVQDPRGNVNAVTLRSGKKLVVAPMEREEDESPELPEEGKDAPEKEENAPEERRPSPVPITETSKINASLPFPVPARAPKQHVMDKDIFELFSKVEINIPLLEAIKQIPRYAKFLKELCTNRRRSARYDQELMSRNVSAVIQRKVPPNAEIQEPIPFHAQLATSGSKTAC
ncbi:unnamed protein product [Rhodiola kirilowii]